MNGSAKTIEYKEIESYELMEMAASAFTDYFIENYCIRESNVALFCGTGNNGGDGVAVAHFLHIVGYSVKLFMVEVSDKYSKDCLLNIDRAEKAGIDIIKLTSADQLPSLDNINVIVDAIFGTGLSRPLSGLAKDVIERINAMRQIVVSIDIPSGFFIDKPTNLPVNER